MAKSKNSKSYNLGKVAGAFAFLALVLSGTLYTINAILALVGGSFDGGVLGLFAQVSLVVAVILSAWLFKKSVSWGKKTWVTILFWICAILAIASVVTIAIA